MFDDPKDDKWLRYRIELFKKYTVKSLMNQRTQVDLLWLSFAGRRNNLMINELRQYLHGIFNTVFTYDDIIYTDDKFIFRNKSNERYESTWHYAWRMLGRSIKRMSPLLLARFAWKMINKNKSLEKRLDKMLPNVVKYIRGDWVRLTRMDSDDMLHENYLWECDDYLPQVSQVLLRENGYVMNCKTKEVAHWRPTTNPQFFTVTMPRSIFKSGKLFKEYWEKYASHEDAPAAFDHVYVLDDGKYLMLMHGNQISSTWNHRFRGELTTINLGEFGL